MKDPQDTLCELIQGILGDELRSVSGIVKVISSEGWSESRLLQKGGGLADTLQAVICTVDSRTRCVPVFSIGLLSKSLIAERVQRIGGRQLLLWQWAGFAYLQYGFTKEQLIAAACQVFEGAKEPLPLGLLPTPGDVLRLTSAIRHWLENRLRNTDGTLNDFEGAMRGEIQLHRSHIEPVSAISEEHNAMLDRLWSIEVPVERFASRSGGLKPLKAAITDFETSWQALETARSVLRAAATEELLGERLAQIVVEIKCVRDVIASAIDATQELDNELKK